MSNTPPIGHDDIGRGVLNFPGYLYSGTGGLDYSSQLLGTDQASGLAPYRQKVDSLLDNQGNGGEFRSESDTSTRDVICSSRAQDDGSYRLLSEQIKTRDMNLGLDVDYKGLDNTTALNMVPKNGGYDPLRNLHGYSSDSALRNYSQNAKDQQPSYPDLSYGRLQPSHPTIDPRISGLHPFSGMFQQPAFNRTYQYDMYPLLSFSYSLDPTKDVSSYGVDRRTTMSQSYSSQSHIGLGQSGTGLHSLPQSFSEQDLTRLYPKGDADRNSNFSKMYPSTYSNPLDMQKKLIENDQHLMSRHTPHLDGYPSYFNSYSQSAPCHQDSSSKYTGKMYNYTGLTPTNGIRQSEKVIDLTNSNSPDIHLKADARRGGTPREGCAPPLIRDSRTTPKENGTHHPMDIVKGREYGRNQNKNPHTNFSHYPAVSMSPYGARMTFPSGLPSSLPVPSYNASDSPSYGPYESSIADMVRSHSVSFDQALAKPGSHWPPVARYHTPSPHQYAALESVKRNGSPSVQYKSKSVPRPVTDLTFSYPDGTSNRVDRQQPASKCLAAVQDSGVNPAKAQLWPKKDESKLSPYENEIMDSARDGKPRTNFGKFDNVPRVHSRSHSACHAGPNTHVLPRPVKLPEYPAPGPRENPTVKTALDHACEPSRNSVIHSLPKLLSGINTPERVRTPDNRQTIANEANSTKEYIPRIERKNDEGVQDPVVQKFDNMAESKNVDVGLEKVSPSRPGRKHKSPKAKDIEQRPKRKYTKRSEIWKKKGVQQQHHDSENPNPFEPTKDTIEPEPQNARLEPDPQKALSEKSERRQRRSGGPDMEEFLYGWFSDEDTENDDSSDEDYSCPANVPEPSGFKVVSKLRATRTLPMRTSRDGVRAEGSSRNEGISEDGETSRCQWKTKRKERRLKSLLLNKSKEATSEKTDHEQPAIDMEKRDLSTTEKGEIQREEEEQKPNDVVEKTVENEIQTLDTQDTEQLVPIPIENTTEQKELPKLETIRKKRKYTRRLDKDGLPIKRAKKAVKSVELIPKKKRGYRKVAEKWFRKKIPDDNVDAKDESNKIIPPGISPALAELYTRDQEVSRTEHATAESATDKTNLDSPTREKLPSAGDGVEKSPRRRKISSMSAPNSVSSSVLEMVPRRLSFQEKPKDNLRIPKIEINVPEEGQRLPLLSAQGDGASLVDTSNLNQDLFKMKKKPGRKPGWRKFVQVVKLENPTNDLKMILKKKYKKPKGDGLPRFGMRKRGRKPKLRIPVTNAIISTPTRSQDPDKEEVQVRPKRKYNMALRLEKRRKFLLSKGHVAEPSKEESSSSPKTPTKTSLGHKISEELQSQEYDYDFNSSLLCSKDEEDQNDDTSLVQSIHKEDSELPSCSTPHLLSPGTPKDCTSLLQQSPFPANLKKLCCNGAIGETQLHKAARLGYIENLRYYLETGTNVNQCDNFGYTALHEACVQNNLEAASLLLQYGADANKYAVDGTRPLHDAIEYDHLEMVRLMLACGADPMLSKFSGRSIPNMIRSGKMGRFITAHLQEIQEIKGNTTHDKEMDWKFPCSGLFDKHPPHSYSALDFPSDAEDLILEFEMYEEPPCNTYLLQTDDDSERTNYCLLDDYLKVVGNQKRKSDCSIKVVAMSVERFKNQIQESTLQNLQYKRTVPKPDLSGEYVELVALNAELSELIGADVIRLPLFDKFATTNQDSEPRPTQQDKHITPCEKEDTKESNNTPQLVCERTDSSLPVTERHSSLTTTGLVNGNGVVKDPRPGTNSITEITDLNSGNLSNKDSFCRGHSSNELSSQWSATSVGSDLTNSATVDEVR